MGHAACVTSLLSRGADATARTRSGLTALMWAASDGDNARAVAALLGHGKAAEQARFFFNSSEQLVDN